jgi:hypothetical protein
MKRNVYVTLETFGRKLIRPFTFIVDRWCQISSKCVEWLSAWNIWDVWEWRLDTRCGDSLQAGRSGVQMPVWERDFLFSVPLQTGPEPPLPRPPMQWIPGHFYGGRDKAARAWLWPSTTSSAEVINRCSYTSTPHSAIAFTFTALPTIYAIWRLEVNI